MSATRGKSPLRNKNGTHVFQNGVEASGNMESVSSLSILSQQFCICSREFQVCMQMLCTFVVAG